MKKNTTLLLMLLCILFNSSLLGQAPVNGKLYKIKNAVASKITGLNLYIGKESPNNAGMISTGIGNVFMLAGVTDSTCNLLQISSGKYLTKQGGWDGVYASDFITTNAQFKIKTYSGDTCTITCLNNSALIGADATADGSSIYLNKAINNNGKWIFEEVTASETNLNALKGYLQVEIDVTQALKGQFGTNEATALATLEGTIASVSEWSGVALLVKDVHNSINAYKASMKMPYVIGNTYKIKNVLASKAAGKELFIGKQSPSNPGVVSTGIGDLFALVAVTANTFNIKQVGTGKYITRAGNGYDGTYADVSTVTNAQFFASVINGDTCYLQCVANSGYLGLDNTADGSPIYFNKGINNNAKWIFVEVNMETFKTALKNAITAANNFNSSTIGGTGTLQYTGKDAFTNAIATAQTVYDNQNATQAELTDAVTALNSALTTYKATLVTTIPEVISTPVEGTFYNIMHSSYNVLSQTSTNASIMSYGSGSAISQTFSFEPVSGQTGVYNLKSVAGNYLACNGYSTLWASTPSTSTQVSLSLTTDNLNVNIKFLSLNFLGTDAVTDGTPCYADKSGTDVKHKWNLIAIRSETILKSAIDNANKILNSAVVGSAIGQYPQAAKDSLQKVTTLAQTLLDSGIATEIEIKVTIKSLNLTANWFQTQGITAFTQYLNKSLYIVHSSGNLLSNVDTISTAVIRGLKGGRAVQAFKLMPVSGAISTFSLKSSDGKYLSYNGWNTPWVDSISSATELRLTSRADGYVSIRFAKKDKVNSLLGADGTADGSNLWADKGDSTAINNKWILQEEGTTIKIKLFATISASDTILSKTKAGTAFFQYPQAKRDALQNLLGQAKTIYADATANQAVVDTMVVHLNNGMKAYYQAQILPPFSPQTDARYIIRSKSYPGYVTSDGAKAKVEQNVPLLEWEIVKVRDSVFVFKSGGKAIAHSLNMVNLDINAADQQWYVHYDGVQQYNGMYVSDTTFYYGINTEANQLSSAMRISNTSTLEIVTSHSHTDQSQWFSIKKIGAPITDVLKATITQIESVLSSTVVGTAYGQYPQSARDSLNTVLNKAKLDVVNVSLTQTEINNSVKSLTNALTYYYNQKVVYKPLSDMGYFLGNYADATVMSVDTVNANNVQGYKLDSIPFDDQMWFFKPVENKAGYYYILNRNKALSATGVDVELTAFIEKSAKQWEITYTKTLNGIEYFNVRGEGSAYPYLYAGTNWAIDRYNGNNNYQIKIVAAGGLRTQIFIDHELLKTVTIGNKLGQYTQEVYNTFASVINSANAVALNNAATDVDRATKLQELKNAETAFKNSYNGYGLDLNALNVSLTVANSFIETTTVIGSESGQCPETVFNALLTAKEAAIAFPLGLNQAGVDAKVIEFNAAIETFKSALLSSTGLPGLIESALTLYNNAVEGTLPGQYAVGSKATFYPAIEVAQQAKIKQPLVQSELILATQALQSALDIFNAAKSPDVDVRDLVDAIAAAKEFLQAYPEDQRTDVRALVQAAEALLASSTKTQEEVDDMTNRLITALTGIDDILNDQVKVLVGNFNLYVRNLPELCMVAVYDLQGQLVVERRADKEINIALKGGAYIVSIQGNHVNKRLVVVIR